jgi:hypothetical protein
MKSCEALKQDIESLQEILNDMRVWQQRLTTQKIIVPSDDFLTAMLNEMKEIEEEIAKLQAEYEQNCTHVIQRRGLG